MAEELDAGEQVAENNRVTILVKPNGSMKVTGTVDFVDSTGNVMGTRTDFSLCRCGHSKQMPFCDSSHRAASFEAPAYMGPINQEIVKKV